MSKSDEGQPDKDGDEPGLGRLAYGYPDPDELHKLLDEAEVSRKISMDRGATWRTYSVAERLKILVGGYKLAVREGDEAERVGWNKALDRAALIAECATPDDGREHESCPFCGTSRQILELKASAAEPSKLAKILAEARASEDYRKEAERLSTPSAVEGSFAPYAMPEVMGTNGRFSTLNGMEIDTPATRLALELGRDIYKHANEAGVAPLTFAQKITEAVNEALRLRSARSSVEPRWCLADGTCVLGCTPSSATERCSEEMADSVRGVLQIIRNKQGATFKDVRRHCEARGDEIVGWPEWVLNAEGYVTEQGAAMMLFEIMAGATKNAADRGAER